MGKKSRRERRQAQAVRASETRDVAALEALVTKSPERAAARLAEELGRTESSEDGSSASLVALAERLAGELRRAGSLEAARRLAERGSERSSRLRLEQGLAAFALGLDDEVTRLAERDPAAAAVLGPLVSAARGEMPAPPARSAPTSARALVAAARAAAGARLGQGRPGGAELQRLAAKAPPGLLTEELGAAVKLALAKRPLDARNALERLASSTSARSSAAVRRAAAAEVARSFPELAPMAAQKLGLGPDERLDLEREVRLSGLVPEEQDREAPEAAALRPRDAGRVLELLRHVGADAFEAEDRPAARLYEGYAWLTQDPARASTAFERAIAGEAELVEALRGKLLAALSLGGRDPRRGQAGRPVEVADAAERLARTLLRFPEGAIFAAITAKIAAEAHVVSGRPQRALPLLEKVRPLVHGALAEELELAEIEALAARDPGRAASRLDAWLARDRRALEAWKLRISLAARSGAHREADDFLVQAAEATGDPRLVAEARDVRAERGELRPFEGLEPGRASAGAIAAELERVCHASPRKEASLELLRRVAPLREALAPPARLALDAAELLVLSLVERSKEGEEAAMAAASIDVLLRWADSPESLEKLAVVALELDADELVVSAARALSARGAPGAVVALGRAASAWEDPPLARKLLQASAAGLRRAELATLERTLAASPPPELAPERVLGGLADLLAPEFDFEGLLELATPVAGAADLGASLEEQGPLAILMRDLGLPPSALEALAPAERARIEAELVELARTGNAKLIARRVPAIVAALFGGGLSPPRLGGPLPRSQAGKSARRR